MSEKVAGLRSIVIAAEAVFDWMAVVTVSMPLAALVEVELFFTVTLVSV